MIQGRGMQSSSPPPGLGLSNGLEGLAVLVDEERHVLPHRTRLHRLGQGGAHVVGVLHHKLVGHAARRLECSLVRRQHGDAEGHGLHRDLTQGLQSTITPEWRIQSPFALARASSPVAYV